MHTQYGMTLSIARQTLIAVEFHRRRAHKAMLNSNERIQKLLKPKIDLLDKAVEDLRRRCFMLEQESQIATRV